MRTGLRKMLRLSTTQCSRPDWCPLPAPAGCFGLSGSWPSWRGASPWPMSPAAKRPAPGKRGRKVSLSLDVPTHVLNTLLELAREKELEAKAAANAELMAQLGRRR
uniref:Corticotropin-releasing factor domain-containing protein n=1 Tax=Strigops habroptila TaxID=2489341 RepID=A0A672V6D8_STRHB